MNSLIVEDDFISRKVMLGFLSAFGECDIAANGKEALEAVALAQENGKRYDLIALDIMMPDLSGLEVLKKIRQSEVEKRLEASCIVMTTALHGSDTIMSAFKLECDAYICKPIDRDKLLNILHDLGLIDNTAQSDRR